MIGLKLKHNSKILVGICFFLMLPSAMSMLPIFNTTPHTTVTEITDEIAPLPISNDIGTLKTASEFPLVIDAVPSIVRRDGEEGYVEFTVTDEDLTEGEEGGLYNITGNVSSATTLNALNVPWNNGELITHPIAHTNFDDSSFNISVRDNFGNVEWQIMTVTSSSYANNLPWLKAVTLTQEDDGTEYNVKNHYAINHPNDLDLGYKPYLECGMGSFTIKAHWEDANIRPASEWPVFPRDITVMGCDIRGIYPDYNSEINLEALEGTYITLWVNPKTPDTYPLIDIALLDWIPVVNLLSNYLDPVFGLFDMNSLPEFTPSGNTYTMTPRLTDQYNWRLQADFPSIPLINPFLEQTFSKRVQDIEYQVINEITMYACNGHLLFIAPEFVTPHNYLYDQQIRNGDFVLEVENKDVHGPTLINMSDDQSNSDANILVIAEIEDEEYGSGINEDGMTLYYSVNGGGYHTEAMLYKDGLFYGNIPPPELGSVVRYYVEMTDMEGNSVNTDIYKTYSAPFEIPPVVAVLIGVLAVTIGSVAITLIYRRRNKPAIITLPSKKKVDKYYKKINKEEG